VRGIFLSFAIARSPGLAMHAAKALALSLQVVAACVRPGTHGTSRTYQQQVGAVQLHP
jgi:hypothetical protein